MDKKNSRFTPSALAAAVALAAGLMLPFSALQAAGAEAQPKHKFEKIDTDSNGSLSKEEARMAGLGSLVQKWNQADTNTDSVIGKNEFIAFMKKHHGGSVKPQETFQQADANNDQKVSKEEAKKASLKALLESWNAADNNNDGVLDKKEYEAAVKTFGEAKGAPMTVGYNKFASPETALWDDKADVYLVSNINGLLTAADDNGFISKVSPDGTILDLKWIDGGKPEVALHGPKGMIFHGDYLVVADVGALRFFDRATGESEFSILVEDSYMLNDPAVGPDRNFYVSDVGSKVAAKPGKVFRIAENRKPVVIAEGIDYDRPDGLIPHGNGLLVTPFEAHADEVYQLSLNGERSPYAKLPKPKLDGLLRLPDDSLIVTSWGGKAVYRLVNKKAEVIAEGMPSPAQVGYDEKRGRLLLPVLQDNKLLIYPLKTGE